MSSTMSTFPYVLYGVICVSSVDMGLFLYFCDFHQNGTLGIPE
jgi:hypothetical protein